MDEEDLRKLPMITLQDLSRYRGQTEADSVYIGVDGRVFDVTAGRAFYGPGGNYHVFAGRDATRALAMGSTQEKDVIGDKTGLSVSQLMKLDDWLDMLEGKYPIVARLETTRKSKL